MEILSDSDVKVILEYIDLTNSKRILFLHSWGLKDNFEEEENYNNALDYFTEDSLTKNKVTKGAYRGYPKSIFTQNKKIAARESWKNIQIKGNTSNLALAPEQEELLSECIFPQFINGQAGSGKSEMLFYIFAEMCFQKTLLGLDDYNLSLVFLTENEELLQRSKLATWEKLQFNSKYQSYAKELPQLDELDEIFWPFIKFVHSLLPKDLAIDFNTSNFINFTKFKALYESSKFDKGIRNKYPAEIVWYIIMTYIKGYTVEYKEVTPEQFSTLLSRDESRGSYISNEDYKEIFEKIWKGFYKKILENRDEPMWDRISLVRKVLDVYKEIPSQFKKDIIVCDEAQDFTRIELELMVKLSKYGEYSLLASDNQIPILFAGDPFQTVNPTGFNLNQVKKLMYDIIEKRMGHK